MHSAAKAVRAPHGNATKKMLMVVFIALLLVCAPAGHTLPAAAAEKLQSNHSDVNASPQQLAGADHGAPLFEVPVGGGTPLYLRAKSFWGAVDQKENLTAQALPQMSRFQNSTGRGNPQAQLILQELEMLGKPKKAKLLIMPPMLFDSHMFIFTSLAAELYRRYGHETTLLLGDRRLPVKAQVPDHEERDGVKPLSPEDAAADEASPTGSRGVHVKRYPSLFSTDEAQAFLQPRVHNILSGYPMMVELYEILGRYTYNCDLLFTEGRPVIEELRQESFDFVLVDPNELCGFLLAKELGLPHAALSTGMWTPAEAAIPQPVSYVPEFNSLQTDRMSFGGRLINLVAYGFSRVGTHLTIFPLYNALIRKHSIRGPSSLHTEVERKDVAELFTRKGLLTVAQQLEAKSARDEDYDEDSKLGMEHSARPSELEWLPSMISRTKAWLVCSDFALDFPRPYLPNVEYVGGILGKPGRPLSAELQAWADSATEGFVVVTFGAAVEKLTPRLQRVFVEGLSMIPHPVIWRFPREAGGEVVLRSNALGSNVKLVDWLPQNDLLAHRNCALFVGHGGTNGAYEALYHGVPVVGMPLFGDHYDSSVRIEAKGFGKFLRWKSLTAERLADAAMAVLADPEIKARAKFLSRVHRDFPGGAALTRAVDRLDYTLRYKGADHLRPAVYELGTMQFWYLDAMLVALAVALVIAMAVRCSQQVARWLGLLQHHQSAAVGPDCRQLTVHNSKGSSFAVPTTPEKTTPRAVHAAAVMSSALHDAEKGGGVVMVTGALASAQQRVTMMLRRLRAMARGYW